MLGIMGDHDIEGQFDQIIHYFLSSTWREVWDGMGVNVVSFASLGLSENSPDVLVW